MAETILHTLLVLFVIAVCGFVLAASAWTDVESLRAKIGAVLVITSIALAMILTPIAFAINTKLIWQARHHRKNAMEEEMQSLIADSGQPRVATAADEGAKSEGESVDQ